METDTESLDIKRTDLRHIVWLTLFGQNVKGSPCSLGPACSRRYRTQRVQTFTMLDLIYCQNTSSNDQKGWNGIWEGHQG
jgi:hypothetical protein